MTDRDRFDDAYAEWWSREVERSAVGRPSRAGSPVAFVTEAVHRTLLDDLRARARGLSRGTEKSSLQLVDIDDQLDIEAAEVTPAQAAYEALAHRVLNLVQDRLSAREMAVFTWTYLYVHSTPATAAGLGLSEPRVKKDRKKIAGKIGEEVWAAIGAELQLCEEYTEQRVAAAFEVFAAHAEDCPACSASVSGLRAGALAILGPIELLALDGAGRGPVSDLVDSGLARLTGLLHRATETAMALPVSGRATAAVMLGAVAFAGGTAALPERAEPAKPVRPIATAGPSPRPSATPSTQKLEATPTPRPGRPRPKPRASVHRRAAAAATPMPTPTATPQITTPSPGPTPAASQPPASPSGEFTFETP